MSGKTINFQNTVEQGYRGIIMFQKIAFISKYGSSLFPQKLLFYIYFHSLLRVLCIERTLKCSLCNVHYEFLFKIGTNECGMTGNVLLMLFFFY